MSLENRFPPIWLGDYHSQSEYDQNANALAAAYSVFDYVDDRMLHSRHQFTMPAYCASCEMVTQMVINWMFAGGNALASINPAWTETCVCEQCGLNSRMRALMAFIKTRYDLSRVKKAYISEQTTPLFRLLNDMVPTLVGSEFLNPTYKSGKQIFDLKRKSRLRHEDLTALSFADAEFDLVLTLDVFEHIPNYRKAFGEVFRVLAPGGKLAFTIPFFFDLGTTRIRATVGPDGIEHHLPPEIHGNPVSEEGSLCFQNFGWDILDDLRSAGFSDARASMYWGPWQGHLGYPFFVFSAEKT